MLEVVMIDLRICLEDPLLAMAPPISGWEKEHGPASLGFSLACRCVINTTDFRSLLCLSLPNYCVAVCEESSSLQLILPLSLLRFYTQPARHLSRL